MELTSVYRSPSSYSLPADSTSTSLSSSSSAPSPRTLSRTSHKSRHLRGKVLTAFASDVLLPVATLFKDSLVSIGNAIGDAGKTIGRSATYHTNRAAYILKHSKESYWDEMVWEDKLKIDSALQATGLDSDMDPSTLSPEMQDIAYQNLMARYKKMQGKQDLAFKELEAQYKKMKGEDNLAFDNVKARYERYKKIFEDRQKEGKTPDDTVLSREKLRANLDAQPQTPVVKILKRFLAETSKEDPTRALDINEWCLVSFLADANVVVQRKELKKYEVKIKEYQRFHQECEHPDRLGIEYRRLALLSADELTALKNEIEDKLQKVVPENPGRHWLAAQSLLLKEIKLKEALKELNKERALYRQQEWNCKVAKDIQFASHFAWNKLAHDEAIDYFDAFYAYQWTQAFSAYGTLEAAVGLDFGFRKIFEGEFDFRIGFRLGVAWSHLFMFTDNELYVGRVKKLSLPNLSIPAVVGWIVGSISVLVSGTKSASGTYQEWPTPRKTALQQLHDDGRSDANVVEYEGQPIDPLVDRHRHDAYFLPMASRANRAGLRDSYLRHYSQQEITNIDRSARQVKQEKVAQSGENKMEQRFTLATTLISHTGKKAGAPVLLDNDGNDSIFQRNERIAAIENEIQKRKKEYIEEKERERDRGVAQIQQDIDAHKVNRKNIAEQRRQVALAEDGIYIDVPDAEEKQIDDRIKKLEEELRQRNEETPKRKAVRQGHLNAEINRIKRQHAQHAAQISQFKLKQIDHVSKLVSKALPPKKADEKDINELVEELTQHLNYLVESDRQLALKKAGIRGRLDNDVRIGNGGIDELKEERNRGVAAIERDIKRCQDEHIKDLERQRDRGTKEIEKEFVALKSDKDKMIAHNHQLEIERLEKEIALAEQERDAPTVAELEKKLEEVEKIALDVVRLKREIAQASKSDKADKEQELEEVQNITYGNDAEIIEINKKLNKLNDEWRDYHNETPQVRKSRQDHFNAEIDNFKNAFSVLGGELVELKEHRRKTAPQLDKGVLSPANYELALDAEDDLSQQEDGIDKINKLALELASRVAEAKTPGAKEERQFQADVAIRKLEKELWVNELKLDLFFELLGKKGALAAQKRNQLRIDLGLNKEIKASKEQKACKAVSPLEVVDGAGHEDGDEAQKIIDKYDYKIAYVIKEAEVNESKRQCQFDVAKVERTDRPAIDKLEAEFKNNHKDGKNSQTEETDLCEIENLELQLVLDIRNIEEEQLKNELQIEHNFNLAIANKQDDKINRLEKEHAINKMRIEIRALRDGLQDVQALELARLKREWNERIASPSAKDTKKLVRQRDEAIREMEYTHAKKIRRAEYELKLEEVKIELGFAKKEGKPTHEIEIKKARLDKEFSIDELERHRDVEVDKRERLARLGELTKRKLANDNKQLAQKCADEINVIETAFANKVSELDPWKSIKDEIRTPANEVIKEKRNQIQKLEKQKKDLPESQHYKIDCKLEERKSDLAVYQLEVEQLLELLPLQSETAKTQRDDIISRLLLSAFFKEQPKAGDDSVDDEVKAQQIRDEYDLKIGEAYIQQKTNTNQLRIDHEFVVRYAQMETVLAENKEAEHGVKQELSKARQKANQDLEDQKKCDREKLKEDIQKRSAPEQQKLKKEKEVEAAKEKERLSWIPVKNKRTSLTNTAVETHTAYLANYNTYSVSAAAKGKVGSVVNTSLEVSGKPYKYTELTRERLTDISNRLRNKNKSSPEKEGIAALLAEELNSPAALSSGQSRTVRQVIHDGWKQRLFSPVADNVRTAPWTFVDINGTKINGFTVDHTHLVDHENCLKYIEEDIKSYETYAALLEYGDVVSKQGAQEAITLLQRNYAANNAHEMLHYMAYSLQEMLAISVQKKSSANELAFQDRILAVEAMVLKPLFKVEKKAHWRDNQIEEHQVVSVETYNIEGTLGAEVNPGPVAFGGYGKGRVELQKRKHVLPTRYRDDLSHTAAIGARFGTPNALPEQAHNAFANAWNADPVNKYMSMAGGATIELAKTVRLHRLHRLEKYYEKLGRPFPGFVHNDTLIFGTKKTDTGGELFFPADKATLGQVPIIPVVKLSNSTEETRIIKEIIKGNSPNTWLMHFVHAKHIGDRVFWERLLVEQHDGMVEQNNNAGGQQFEVDKTPYLDEWAARTLEMQEDVAFNTAHPDAFRKYEDGLAQYLKVTKYAYVINNKLEMLEKLETACKKGEITKEVREAKALMIEQTYDAAMAYFKGKGAPFDECLNAFESLLTAYEVYDYYMMQNSEFYGDPTMLVNGERKTVDLRPEKGSIPSNKQVQSKPKPVKDDPYHDRFQGYLANEGSPLMTTYVAAF